MRTFSIEGKDDSPEVYFDEGKLLIEITGNSTLKNTNWFYSNLLKWMIAFNLDAPRKFTVNIRLQRINDSSAKWLTVIFKKLKDVVPRSGFEINWHLHEKSRRIEASGLQLQNEAAYPVNMVS